METINQTESNIVVNSQEHICCALTTKNNRCKMKAKWVGKEGEWHGVGLCQRHYNMGLQNIRTIYHANSYPSAKKKKAGLQKNKFHSRKVNTAYQYTKDEINRIIKIQSIFRKNIVNLLIKNRGIAVFCRHLITNSTDFGEFSDIKDSNIVSNSNFISFRDEQNNYWGFDIATFKELLKYSNKNPYNTNDIPENIINNFKIFLSKIEKFKTIEIKQEKITNPKIILQQRCIHVFQLIDNLNHYTQCSWFTNLNLNLLKELYKQVEDIWNYRVGLTKEDKLKYVKDGKLFTRKIHEINAIKSKNELSHIILDDFEKLVTQGKTKEDCQTGALWVLSGLTIVSNEARLSMPWLFQSANVY